MTVYPTLVTTIPTPYLGSTPRAKATRHPLVRPGTKTLWDCRMPELFPSSAITPGSAPVGTVFPTFAYPDASGNDLGPNAVIAGSHAFTINADGSLALPHLSSLDFINIGSAGEFNMHGIEYEFVVITWFKLPASGYTTTAFSPLFQLTNSNANNSQFTIDMGSDGLRPRGTVGLGGTSVPAGYASDITPGVLHQFAFRYAPGAPVQFYADGALVATGGSGPASLIDAPSAFLQFVGILHGDLYGYSLTDIGASAAAESEMDLPPLTAAQHILADYQFGAGTLDGAPSVAFGA